MSRPLITIQTTGLRATAQNLATLSVALGDQVVKDAARPATTVLKDAVAGSIYRGLTEQSGLLRSGLYVTIGKNRGQDRITGYVGERQVGTGGKSALAKVAHAAASRHRRANGSIADRFGAFYWRFLEFSTEKRVTKSGANRGKPPATGNVRDAFSAAGVSAIETFRTVFIDRTNEEVSKLPSTKGVP